MVCTRKHAKSLVEFTHKHQPGHTPPAVVAVVVENALTDMSKSNEKIIAQKEKMAADVLQVADDALQDIKVCMSEASVKDLLAIFNSAVKTHRDLMSDIVSIQDKESKEEQKLASEYTGKVDELLKKLSNKPE